LPKRLLIVVDRLGFGTWEAIACKVHAVLVRLSQQWFEACASRDLVSQRLGCKVLENVFVKTWHNLRQLIGLFALEGCNMERLQLFLKELAVSSNLIPVIFVKLGIVAENNRRKHFFLHRYMAAALPVLFFVRDVVRTLI